MQQLPTFTVSQIRDFEALAKGLAHVRRIRILFLLAQSPGLSIELVSQQTKIPYKSASQHINTLQKGRLIYKKREPEFVAHILTPRGQWALLQIKSFSQLKI